MLYAFYFQGVGTNKHLSFHNGCFFISSHLHAYFSLKWTKYISTMNDSVDEFNIQCISGFRKRNGLAIQILWFQILSEQLNFSFHSHLLSIEFRNVNCFQSMLRVGTKALKSVLCKYDSL